MTPKEKAITLVGKFILRSVELGHSHSVLLAEANALIAVDEFIEYLRWTQDYHLANYWREVKQEIELL